MKTVLFVPGFQEDLHSRDYGKTLAAIKNRGYAVNFVQIQWKRTTIDDWVKELEAVYAKHDPKLTVLAGFSYGSMTALVAASHRLPSELWLFSLSPYFSEDIPALKLAYLRSIGKQRTERFWRVSFNKLAPSITCKTLLFVGEKEAKQYPVIGVRSEAAAKLLSNNKLTYIPNCGHDVANPNYVQAIALAI